MFIRNSTEKVEKTCKDPSPSIYFKDNCGFDIDDGGWTLVRHVPNETTWHPSSDQLQGTDVYGVSSKGPEGDEAWSIHFETALPSYDEILISSGNCHNWLITEKSALIKSRKGTLMSYDEFNFFCIIQISKFPKKLYHFIKIYFRLRNRGG